MILVLDNYDSFTYNLVQLLGELGADPEVERNDQITAAEVLSRAPAAVVVSPGPCTPGEAGISVELIRAASQADVPVLGVCLGHQAVAEAFGGSVVKASRQMHGKTSEIQHDGDSLFDGIPSPMRAMRYHSLIVDPASLPGDLQVLAWSGDRRPGEEIMALRHRRYRVWGVQFHPESIGTVDGRRLVENFLVLAGVPAGADAVPGRTS